MLIFLRIKKSISAILILAILVSLSPFLITEVSAQTPGPMTNSAQAAPIAAGGASLLGACVPLATGNGLVCDPSVRYNTYQILLSTLGIGPGVAQRQTYWNSIFFFAMRIFLREITMSIVNWINTGFQGNPSFIQDPKGFLQKDADRVIGNFIQSSDLNFLCEPFKINVKLTLGLQYTPFKDTINCRLTDVLKNTEGAYKDFMDGDFVGGGGWESWLAVTTVPQNNQMGVMLMSETKLNAEINDETLLKNGELSWGNGILSMKECTRTTKNLDGKVIGTEKYKGDSGFYIYSDPVGTVTSQSSKALYSENQKDMLFTGTVDEQCQIVTPGTMISDQLHNATDWDTDALNVADDINEIVGALGNFVITKAINKGFALINKDELSPNDPSWRDGIKQMQSQIGNDMNIVGKNPNYEPNPAIYTQDNGGIINDPNNQGYYVDPAEVQALDDAKKSLQDSVNFYRTPEESYFAAFNSIYTKTNEVVSKNKSVIACYETKLDSTTINPPLDSAEKSLARDAINTASSTVFEMKKIQDSVEPNLIRSNNNLNSLENISNAINSATKIDQLKKPSDNLSIIIPQIHAWDSAIQDTATTTSSQLDEEIVNADTLKTQCDAFPER